MKVWLGTGHLLGADPHCPHPIIFQLAIPSRDEANLLMNWVKGGCGPLPTAGLYWSQNLLATACDELSLTNSVFALQGTVNNVGSLNNF